MEYIKIAIIILFSTLISLTLASCADPQIVYKPVPVQIPVQVPCHVPEVAKPQWSTNGITVQNTLTQQVRSLVVTEKERQAYEEMLEASIKACE